MFCVFPVAVTCSTSEPDAEATLDKMFDDLAFKQNDSKSWQTLQQISDLGGIFLMYILSLDSLYSNTTASSERAQQESASEQSLWDHRWLYVWGAVWQSRSLRLSPDYRAISHIEGVDLQSHLIYHVPKKK